jgi:LPS-assembly protein
MSARRGIFITVTWLCHLLLAAVLVTNELHAQTPEVPAPNLPVSATIADTGSQGSTEQSGSAAPSAPAKKKKAPRPANAGEPVTLIAHQQERHGDLYRLRGEVEVDFRNYKLHADEVTYDDTTGEVKVNGHVVLDGGPHDLHLTASHGTYNVNTDRGRFFDVVGTMGLRLRGKSMMLTSSNPFAFRGQIVDKEGADKYIVHYGMITTCSLIEPKWSFHAKHATVVVGDQAKLYNSTFWLWRLPVFYSPFFDHPTERAARKTGFLLPMAGVSTVKGEMLGEGFFWAINRSTDLTLGTEYYSKRGWSQRANFREFFSDHSYLLASYYGVLDRGYPGAPIVKAGPGGVPITLQPLQDQGGEEVRVGGENRLSQNTRAVLDADYLSSFLFRNAFATTFSEAINSEVLSDAFLSNNPRGYSFNVLSERYQSFQSNTTSGDVVTIMHLPSLQASTVDRQLANSPLYWGFTSSLDGLRRSIPLPQTEINPPIIHTANTAGRFDVFPHLSLPKFFHGWTFRPEVAVRDTFYTDSLVPGGAVGQTSASPVNRHAFEAQLELRPPPLERMFDSNWLDVRLKHTIEPRLTYRDVTGIDNFSKIPRFDARDVYNDTNEIEYALVQRLYTKPLPRNCGAPATSATTTGNANAQKKVSKKGKPKNCTPVPARELLSWEVGQKYFFDPYFGGALVPGELNVLASTLDLSAISFLTAPRAFSPVSSRLRLRTGRLDSEWHVDYDPKLGRINSSQGTLTYSFPRDIAVTGGDAFLQVPAFVTTSGVTTAASKFNQFNVGVRYGTSNRRGLNLATNFARDANLGHMLYALVQTTYNWDCCGITVEYRRFFISSTVSDNQYRIALSLSNVGTFGNLRRTERLF